MSLAASTQFISVTELNRLCDLNKKELASQAADDG
jgi:hypothetical protein